MLLDWLLAIAVGFVSGGVMYSYMLPRRYCSVDVCQNSQDRNPGAFNAVRQCGWPMGLLCLALDVAKGAVPVLLAQRLLGLSPDSGLFALVLAAPVLGHGLALFSLAPGGKGIAVSFGVLLGVVPHSWAILILAVLYILLSTVLRIPSNRIRSIVTYAVFALASGAAALHQGSRGVALGGVLISIIVIWKHHTAPDAQQEAAAGEAVHIKDRS